MNLSLFHLINQQLAHPILDGVMAGLTWVGDHGWIFAAPWLLLMFFGGKKGRRAGWAVIPLILLSDFVPGKILKPFFELPRPFMIIPDTRLVVPLTTDISPYGFPSNHASNMAALGLFFSLVYPKKSVWIPFLFLAGLVGFSRVYIGVHFPVDILAGFVWGALCAVLVFNGMDIFHNKASTTSEKGSRT